MTEVQFENSVKKVNRQFIKGLNNEYQCVTVKSVLSDHSKNR